MNIWRWRFQFYVSLFATFAAIEFLPWWLSAPSAIILFLFIVAALDTALKGKVCRTK
jgi:hypothetical protein